MNDHAESQAAPELAALLQEISPLPLSGQAWPDWVRILAWVLLAVLGVEVMSIFIRMPPENAHPAMGIAVLVCFLALAVVAWFMQTSVTTIDARGMRQAWYARREILWEEVQSARYVPLIFSKRLLVFRHKGRPVIFQGGTRELQQAFAKIAATFDARQDTRR